jgi:hypothetical protein
MVEAPGNGLGTVRLVHERGRTVVVEEAEKLRPGVVSDGIHHPLALGHQREVHVGDQDALTLPERVGEVTALGRDDRGAVAAAAEPAPPTTRR